MRVLREAGGLAVDFLAAGSIHAHGKARIERVIGLELEASVGVRLDRVFEVALGIPQIDVDALDPGSLRIEEPAPYERRAVGPNVFLGLDRRSARLRLASLGRSLPRRRRVLGSRIRRALGAIVAIAVARGRGSRRNVDSPTASLQRQHERRDPHEGYEGRGPGPGTTSG